MRKQGKRIKRKRAPKLRLLSEISKKEEEKHEFYFYIFLRIFFFKFDVNFLLPKRVQS
jgi:hypothetical protein